MTERLAVGLVRGLHGLKGAVRVEVLTDELGRFEPGARVFAEDSEEPLTVDWMRTDSPGLLVRFREIASRDAAESLRDTYLEAEVGVSAGDDRYYWHEVVGLTVTASSGESLGQVHDIFRVGEGEVYVVRGGERGELLIPAVRAVVRELAPREGRLVVDAEALGLEPTG